MQVVEGDSVAEGAFSVVMMVSQVIDRACLVAGTMVFTSMAKLFGYGKFSQVQAGFEGVTLMH